MCSAFDAVGHLHHNPVGTVRGAEGKDDKGLVLGKGCLITAVLSLLFLHDSLTYY
jgi:hypothetical protein